jgi:hypothetical protein
MALRRGLAPGRFAGWPSGHRAAFGNPDAAWSILDQSGRGLINPDAA